MGVDDKVKNAAEEAKGKVTEGVGKATGDQDLEARGKGEQVAANVKQGVEDAADAVKEGIGRVASAFDKNKGTGKE